MLSGTTSSTRYFRVYLMSDATDGSGTWGTSAATGALYETLYTYSTALANYGQECAGHCGWTFTVPGYATRTLIQIMMASAGHAEFAAGRIPSKYLLCE